MIRVDPFGAFRAGEEWGAREGGRIRDARAFGEGGLDAVADAAGRAGDMEGMEVARGMQRRQRVFEDDQRQAAYERMETIAPWARNVVRATQTMDPARARAFLSQPNIQQRFLDFGLSEDQVAAGIAGLTSEDPEERAQWVEQVNAAFTQHQNPEWQVSDVTGEIYAVDPETGQPISGGRAPDADLVRRGSEARIALNERNASAPYTGVGSRPPSGYRWREDGDLEVIPGGPAENAANRGQIAGAEMRGRLALSLPNIVQAQDDLAQLESQALENGNETPIGQDWGARLLEAIPFDGGAVARMAGGADYQAYETAMRSFESNMIPIFSGSAVTESEAQRFVRANLPRLGDNPETLRRKAQNRARMVNSAAILVGEQPPYPESGYWEPSAGLVRPQSSGAPPASGGGAVGLESLSDEQLDALEQELMNGGR